MMVVVVAVVVVVVGSSSKQNTENGKQKEKKGHVRFLSSLYFHDRPDRSRFLVQSHLSLF